MCATMQALVIKTEEIIMSREKTGLKHAVPCNFRTDKKGYALIQRRRKANKMSQAEYLRYAVEFENDMRDRLYD